jgi:hypothetical protein
LRAPSSPKDNNLEYETITNIVFGDENDEGETDTFLASISHRVLCAG